MTTSAPVVTTSPIAYVEGVILQVANTMPSGDEGWATLPSMRYEGASEDLGQQLGELLMRQNFGTRTQQGGVPFKYLPDPEMINGGLGGMIVRALQENEGGSITVNGQNYTAFWWGQVVAPSTNPDGAPIYTGGQGEWRCASIASVLASIDIANGYVLSLTAGPNEPSTPGRCPPFNALPGGDMSAAQITFPNGSAYIHDLTTIVTGNQWSAYDILQLLLVGFANPSLTVNTTSSGFTWQLSDPTNCLGYIPATIDLDGMSVLQAINELISEARGLTWWTTVSDEGVCTITASTVLPTAITAPGYTMPAAYNLQTVSVIGQTYYDDVNVTEDWTQVYDKIIVRGDHPWVGFTVNIENGSLQAPALLGAGYGWAAGAGTNWAAYPEGYPYVFRRWQIGNNWLGSQYAIDGGEPTNGLRNWLNAGTLPLYGAGGLDGTRQYNPGLEEANPPAFMVRGERFLPAGIGDTENRIGPHQPPVVVRSYGNQTTWADLTRWYDVEVQDFPLAVMVDDRKQGKINQALYEAGEALLITIGVREVEPLQVSWVQQPGSLVNGSPRIKVIDMPQCQQWIVLANTVTGVNYDSDTPDGFQQLTSSTLALTSSDKVVRDDTPFLQAALALVQPWLSLPAVTCRWTDRGGHDISPALRSGALVTSFIRGDGTVTANGIVRRSWSVTRETVNGNEMVYYNTLYNTRRLAPNFGVVIAHLSRGRA